MVLCFFTEAHYCMCFTCSLLKQPQIYKVSQVLQCMEILDISGDTSNSLCECGTPFSVDHVLSYPKRGLHVLSLCQNDLTATLLTEVCSQVCTKPEMWPVHNPDDFHLYMHTHPLAFSIGFHSSPMDLV